MLASLQQREGEDLLGQANIQGEDFFCELLQSLNIAIHAVGSKLRWGGRLIDWHEFDTYYEFDFSNYEQDVEDSEKQFSELLQNTPLAKYETVILNWGNSCSGYSNTMIIEYAVFVEKWEDYFDAITFIITPDGQFVLEAWDDHWFGMRSNFPIGSIGKYLSRHCGDAQRNKM